LQAGDRAVSFSYQLCDAAEAGEFYATSPVRLLKALGGDELREFVGSAYETAIDEWTRPAHPGDPLMGF
jgi:hypothetical protein